MSIINKINYLNQIRKYYLTMLGFDRREEIKKVNFEPCAVCNINCAYCNFEHKNNREKFLDKYVFLKVLSELYVGPYNLKQISLSQSGEVLLHPDFKELVRMLKTYKDLGLRTKRIVMNTNLMLLTEDIIDFLLDIDVFTIISCSIDGKNKESFERLRKGADYDKCMKNFLHLVRKKSIRNNKKLEIRVNNGNDIHSNKLYYDDDFFNTIYLADKVIKYDFHDWNGNIDVEGYKPSVNKGFCQFMFNTVLITTDGGVAKCCNDLNASTVYGNIKSKTLNEVYHSDRRKEYLKLMYNNKRYMVKGCEKCTRE